MALTPNLGLTITPLDESTKRFVDFRSEIAGDSPTSNMVIIDTEFGKLQVKIEEYEADTSERFSSVDGDIKGLSETVENMNNIGISHITVSVPVNAWVSNNTSTLYVYRADVSNANVTEAHYPVGTPTINSLAEAQYCGLAPIVQTLDGVIRFYSETIPSSALTIDLALWEE